MWDEEVLWSVFGEAKNAILLKKARRRPEILKKN